MRRWLGAALLLACPAVAQAQQVAKPLDIQPVPHRPIAGGFTLATAGDLIYLRAMLPTIEAQAPDMLALLRDADVTFGNFETNILDLGDFAGSPQAESGGTWMFGAPGVPADVRAMGFDLVGMANNHGTDWGVEGMLETARRLDAAGIVHAGADRNLSAARAPRYLDMAKGRIGLVAATTSFTPMSRAADPIGEVPGRPGVNALRTQRTTLIPAEQIEPLAQIAGAARPDGKTIELSGVRYRASTDGKPGLSYALNPADLQANLRSIRQAHENGNFTIFSLHNHEPGNPSQAPADFAGPLAHAAIDAGADVVVGHGPHQLRGIEIYKGRPIFYSLGNFAMMNNSLDQIPADMYDQYGVAPAADVTTPELVFARNAQAYSNPLFLESVIATSRFVDGAVAEIRLYPLDLGSTEKGAGRGVPRLADAHVGRRVLERLQALSAPFGTRIVIEKGVGVIRP
ncbi:CapA family protein [Sphingomonas sp. dw_22]|uniref:CapA family protein n=1 Tax=Sphingomonas sp. dw_22 TaxID=2721175 RepID=UPI001BD1F75A|nr:CapA family protein [Sphingomonas sp. dw_22]